VQRIEQLQARALRRADAVDEMERMLYAAKGQRRRQEVRDETAGLWVALKRLFLPNRSAAKVEKLEVQQTRARAALKIAVDELHQAHCEQLRAAPWSGTLLAPTEAELRDANEDYHPWDLVQMAGKRALSALYKIDADGDSDSVALAAFVVLLAFGGLTGVTSSTGLSRRIEAMNRAGDAIQGFVNALRFLARTHPEVAADSDSASLTTIAANLAGVRTRFGMMAVAGKIGGAKRTIAAILTSVTRASGSERGARANAQDRLEEVNHQIALAAWSKIPARLRPQGR
jgi:hypothetical protein